MKKITTLSIAVACLLNTNVLAQDNNEDLGTITVLSATKSDQSIENTTANIEVISSAELEEQHVKNVGEALKRVAGISLNSNGGVGQLDTLYIRGIQSKRILILIDGIRYNEPTSSSGAPLAQLMIDDVEQIEIVKGAQSGIWGADASGGVINIITKKAKNGVHGSILTETGSFNTKKYAGSLSAKTDKFFVNVNASKFSTSGFSAFEAKKSSKNYGKRGDELGLEDDGYKNKTYTLNAGINITDNDSITALYKNIDSEYEYDNSSSDSLTNISYLNHYFKALNYTHKTDVYSLKVSASQSKFDREQGTTHAKGKVNEFSILNQINYLKNDTFTIGVNKQNFEDITNKTKYQISALFASNLNKFDKLIISETIRYDDNNKFEKKITGKLGARYNFNKDLYISANYGTAYNAPTLANLGYTPTLEPETTKSLDASISLYGFKATYFESKIKNMIDFDFSPSFHYFNEEGTTVLKGYEFEYEKNILEDLLLTLNYTRLSAKNDDGKDKRRRPEETVNLGLNYYGIEKLHLGLNTEFVGKRYNSDDNTGAQTGRYTVSNVVINYDITKDIKVYGKINNITDRYYQTIDGYSSEARGYYAGLKYSF